MKKVFLLWAIYACTNAQTLDINALRMAQSSLGANLSTDSQTSNVTQSQGKVIIDMPINPAKYKVGPGDQFRVNIISSDDISIYTLVVSPTGDVLITNIGIVPVNGLTLDDAVNTIQSTILQAKPTAKSHILLSEIREFKIKVIGQLRKPGFYTVTPVSRVSDLYKEILLELQSTNDQESEIPEHTYPEVSRRNIEIFRNG